MRLVASSQMRKTRIVTHNGKAHRDEYLACCVILYHEYRQGRLCFIERRMVGDTDLGCKDTWVVDAGGHWDPDYRNFDHHQDDASLQGLCAVDLVLLHILGKTAYDTFRAVNPWMRVTATHDTLGASAAASLLGVDVKGYISTWSPIEKATLAHFGETQVVHIESPMICGMRETGRMILTEAEELSVGIPDALNGAAPPFEHVGLRIWDIRHVDCGDDTVSMALVNQAASSRGADVVLGKNSRTGGWGIYREAWATDKLDLSRLRDMPGVKFTHKNGFYAVVTNEVTDAGLLEMLTVAARRQPVATEAVTDQV